jgi:predicted dehydrogenase
MTTQPIGIGVIGAGGIAIGQHLPAYQKLQAEGKVKIIGIADINEASAKSAAEKFSIPSVFTDYKKLLEESGLDAVSVCTPNFLHKDPAVAALRSGKHVLVEKPLARNAIEGVEMVEAARISGKKLQVGLNMRFGTGAQAVKRFVDDGRLGEVYFARCHALRRRGIPGWGVFTQKDKQGGGPLIDIGVHVLDVTMWLMGNPKPASVSGQTYAKFGRRSDLVGLLGKWDPAKFDVEDYAVGFVRFKNGASLVIESSFAANMGETELYSQLMGTEGGAYLDLRNLENLKIYREESGVLTDSIPYGLVANNSHEAEIRSFINAIQTDEPVEASGEQGLVVSQILDAIYESSDTGREIVF